MQVNYLGRLAGSQMALKILLALIAVIANFSPWQSALADSKVAAALDADVIIYGGTPAGIAAAISAGESGRSVLLVEPYKNIGGLVTNGLSHTDLRTFEGMAGKFLDFANRVQSYYAGKYGPDSIQAKDSLHGSMGEPHVNLLVFEAMLAEHSKIKIVRQTRLLTATLSSDGRRIESITVNTPSGEKRTWRSRIYIDASYEGDLMAAAKVPYRVGREGRDEHGEMLAPPKPDKQLQGYNFRLCMTQDPKLRVKPVAPLGYDRQDFADLLKILNEGKIESVFVYPAHGIYKAQIPQLPNGKYDINDVSRSAVRLSLPPLNLDWPDASPARRQEIYNQHARHNMGMIYFLQTDPDVPKKYRDEAVTWGWCKDEFTDNGHLPEQIYVREARRMQGMHIYTEKDFTPVLKSIRAPLHLDSIAMCDYQANCHGTDHEGSPFGGKHTGDFYRNVPPHQVPYGTIVPKNCENLLVPVAISSSHVGFCSLRYEAVWTVLGQAAGIAANLAIANEQPVQKIDPLAVQAELHARGAATIYVSDVPQKHADFLAVQWWASQGGLHEPAPPGVTPGTLGKNIAGQYHEAYLGHAADLNQPLDEAGRRRWLMMASALCSPNEAISQAKSRREFIRAAYKSRLLKSK